jgi:hypothetical protein
MEGKIIALRIWCATCFIINLLSYTMHCTANSLGVIFLSLMKMDCNEWTLTWYFSVRSTLNTHTHFSIYFCYMYYTYLCILRKLLYFQIIFSRIYRMGTGNENKFTQFRRKNKMDGRHTCSCALTRSEIWLFHYYITSLQQHPSFIALLHNIR